MLGIILPRIPYISHNNCADVDIYNHLIDKSFECLVCHVFHTCGINPITLSTVAHKPIINI